MLLTQGFRGLVSVLWGCLFLAGGSVWAKSCPAGVSETTLEVACSRNLSGYGSAAEASKKECLAAGKDEYVDSCALGICVQFKEGCDKTSCVRAARGRVYSTDDVRECFKAFKHDKEEVFGCLGERGTSQARVYLLQLSEEKGRQLGASAAALNKPEWDQQVARDRGVAAAKKVGGIYLDRSGFNKGLVAGRESKDPLHADAFAEGRTQGEILAREHAEKYARTEGFNAALAAAIKSEQIPAHFHSVSLASDKTPSLAGDGNLPVQALVPLASQGVAVAPVPQKIAEPSKAMLPDSVATPSDLPSLDIPSVPASAKAPCLASDDTACIKAFKDGYKEGYRQYLVDAFGQEYKGAYAHSFAPTLASVLTEPLPPASVLNGETAASRERGVSAGYTDESAVQVPAFHQIGAEDFARELAIRPLVRLVSLEAKSAAGNLVVPRGKFAVSVTVDNLSGANVPAGYLNLSLSDLSKPEEAFSWDKAERVLPELPAGSRTQFDFSFTGTAPGGGVGKARRVMVTLHRLSQRATGKLSYVAQESRDLSIETNYPAEITEIRELSPFSGEAEVNARISITNKRKQASRPYTGNFTAEPQAVHVEKSKGIAIPELQPGEVFEFETKLRPTVWTNFRKSTDFVLRLANAEGVEESRQVFPKMVDTGRPVGLRIVYQGADYSGDVIHTPINARRIPLSIQLDCTQEIFQQQGYSFRYLGSSTPGFSFVGTVGAEIGSCKPGRGRTISYGSIWLPENHHVEPAAIRFTLEQNGAVVQAVQVFVQTLAGTESRSRSGYCPTCP